MNKIFESSALTADVLGNLMESEKKLRCLGGLLRISERVPIQDIDEELQAIGPGAGEILLNVADNLMEVRNLLDQLSFLSKLPQ